MQIEVGKILLFHFVIEIGKIGDDCYIDCQTVWVTTMCWPKMRNSECMQEHLLMGRINGTVALLTIEPNNIQREELDDCSQLGGNAVASVLHII